MGVKRRDGEDRSFPSCIFSFRRAVLQGAHRTLSRNMHVGRNKVGVWNVECGIKDKMRFVSLSDGGVEDGLRSCCGPSRKPGRRRTPLEQTWSRPRPRHWSASGPSCSQKFSLSSPRGRPHCYSHVRRLAGCGERISSSNPTPCTTF